MKHRLKKLLFIAGLWVSLLAFLLLSDPETLFLPLLVVPFLLLAASLYMTFEAISAVLLRNVSKKRIRVMAGVAACLPTMLLVLSSVKQLTIRDTAIMIGLLVVLLFYMKRVDFLAP